MARTVAAMPMLQWRRFQGTYDAAARHEESAQRQCGRNIPAQLSHAGLEAISTAFQLATSG